MQVAESTLLEGKMIHLNEQTGAFEPDTLHILRRLRGRDLFASQNS